MVVCEVTLQRGWIKRGMNTWGQQSTTMFSAISIHSSQDRTEILFTLVKPMNGVRPAVIKQKSSLFLDSGPALVPHFLNISKISRPILDMDKLARIYSHDSSILTKRSPYSVNKEVESSYTGKNLKRFSRIKEAE